MKVETRLNVAPPPPHMTLMRSEQLCSMLTCVFFLLRASPQRDGTDCLPPQHAAPSRMATDELSRVSVKLRSRKLSFGSVSFRWLMSARSPQNQVDTLNLPFQCRVNLASHREVAVRISGVMRLENLHAVSVKPPTRERGCFRGVQDLSNLCVLISASAPI